MLDAPQSPGCRCAACGASTSDSVLGASGWHTLRRNASKAVSFCPECYREFAPVRIVVASRYADACETLRAAKALAAEQPHSVDARAALALAGVVFGLARREWLDEQEGGERKAS